MNPNTLIAIAMIVWFALWMISCGYKFSEVAEIRIEDVWTILAIGIFAPLVALIIAGGVVSDWYRDNKDRTLITLRKPERKALNSEMERWK